jgi:hypothetical protein
VAGGEACIQKGFIEESGPLKEFWGIEGVSAALLDQCECRPLSQVDFYVEL